MKNYRLLIAIVTMMFTTVAHADWAILGIAVKCDEQAGKFSMVPTVKTSSPEYNHKAPLGFIELGKEKSQRHICGLGVHSIELNINVYGPQPRGVGQGAGVIIIDSLNIDNHPLIGSPTNFNWQVINERVLTEIHIEVKEGYINSMMCESAGWSWDSSYPNKECSVQSIERKANNAFQSTRSLSRPLG